jgi:hypothetical protein
MLRRYGPWAMGVLMGAGVATAQEPIPASSFAPPAGALSGPVPMDASAISHDPHGQGWLRRRALTDTLGANYELSHLRSEANPLHEPISEAPGVRYGCGPRGGRGFGGDPDAGAAADFQAANPWARTNVEKKLFILYQHATPYSTATKLTAGQYNGAQVGMEVLPWVLRDDDKRFTRFGWSAAFDYRDYRGNLGAIVQSELSGNNLAVAGGTSFGALLGGTWRTDFHFFGIRMSPNVTAGLDLDWASFRQAAPNAALLSSITLANQRPPNELPTVQPQVVGGPDFPWLTPQSTLPLAAGQSPLYSVQQFRSSDFSVGGYFKSMIDFPIRQHLNLGIGFDVRVLPGKAFLRDGDARKHIGLLLQIGGDF